MAKKAHPSEAAPARPSRLVARRERAERNLRVFNLLKAGVPVAQIALQEGLSARRTREIIQETLDRREIDPPEGFVQLQIGRLSDAMMVAHAAMMEGNLQALDRLVKIVGELDRYHGFGRAPSGRPVMAAALLPPAAAPALALPAPADAAENRPAKD
ncbi:MAG TPA: hypothetical protein VGH40_09750 [Roseiarcus sp.]